MVAERTQRQSIKLGLGKLKDQPATSFAEGRYRHSHNPIISSNQCLPIVSSLNEPDSPTVAAVNRCASHDIRRHRSLCSGQGRRKRPRLKSRSWGREGGGHLSRCHGADGNGQQGKSGGENIVSTHRFLRSA